MNTENLIEETNAIKDFSLIEKPAIAPKREESMKILTLSDPDAEELGKKFVSNLLEIESKHVIIHVSTFYNTIDEHHKALIVYEK